MQDQNCLLSVFLGWNSKKLMCCGILHQHPQILPNTAFRPKIKILKFGTKIALIGYFGLEFQKTSVVFEISILEFLKTQSFIQKQKKLYIFGLQFNKSYYQVFNQHPRICETINFHPKQKKTKTWDQKNPIWVFGLEC